MPKNVRRQFTKEFKLDVVYKKLANIYSTKEICEIYNLDRQTMCRWVNEFKKQGESAFDSQHPVPGDELRKLQERNKKLEMENEILKKAEAYFALRNQIK